MIKKITYFGLIAGILLLVILLVWQGFMEVLQLLISSGWQLLLIPLVWLPSVVPTTESWRFCFRDGHWPSVKDSLIAMWVGRAINNLLPVATIGGEVIKARMMVLNGCRVADASASVMVDKTLQALALILWGLIGIGFLLNSAKDDGLAIYAITGFLILSAAVSGFVLVQKYGMFSLMAKLGGAVIKTDSWDGITDGAKDVDAIVLEVYGNRKRFLLALVYKTLGLILQTTEVWLACYLLGHPIGLVEALMLKSLTATITDIAFIIPNGYGIQEGAFIMVGALMGIDAELALAISLAIRIRELIIDLPALLYWHQIESRLLLKKTASAS